MNPKRIQWTLGSTAGTGDICLVVDTKWLVGHLAFSIAQVFTNVHAESASAHTKAVSLGAKLASVTLLTPEGVVVAVGTTELQPLVAQLTLEASLVP